MDFGSQNLNNIIEIFFISSIAICLDQNTYRNEWPILKWAEKSDHLFGKMEGVSSHPVMFSTEFELTNHIALIVSHDDPSFCFIP